MGGSSENLYIVLALWNSNGTWIYPDWSHFLPLLLLIPPCSHLSVGPVCWILDCKFLAAGTCLMFLFSVKCCAHQWYYIQANTNKKILHGLCVCTTWIWKGSTWVQGLQHSFVSVVWTCQVYSSSVHVNPEGGGGQSPNAHSKRWLRALLSKANPA